MEYRNRNLPTVNEMGKELEAGGHVAFGKRAYNQTSSKCFEIASKIAGMFGYSSLQSRAELTGRIFSGREEQLGWRKVKRKNSPASLVIRAPDNLNDVHVAFELFGQEYNYGPGVREGFEETMRIPLYPQ